MTPPRRVRKAPLADRVQAYLNPWDFLLWLSEEINSSEWQDCLSQWAIPGGIAANIVFLVARANTGGSSFARNDDVFGDYHERGGTGWLAWFVSASGVSCLSLRRIKAADIQAGLLHRTPSKPRLLLECFLHLLPATTLPAV